MTALRLIPILFVFFGFSTAQAFFHFEPGIGYNRGHYQTSKLQGIGLTLKTGAEFQNFFLLADVGYHDLQLGSLPTSTATDLGLAIGGDFKKWRFWFTYLVSADLKTESGGTTATYSGDGFKLGISGNITGKAYVNLEMRFIDLTDNDGTPISQFIDAGFISVSWKLF